MNALDNDYESFPAHTRIPDDEILAVYVELTMNGEYALLPYEEEWRERGPLLQQNGYQLRPRYDLDWQPSWAFTNINPYYCEDAIDSTVPNVMDAIRMEDGLAVAVKATYAWSEEANIAFLFTDGNAIAEPRNHCVPILDTFIDENSDIVYIVMPLLRAFNDPPFVAVAEVIDFVDQLIQGIEYMHEQGVAHRDITSGNIMMDASDLFPEGFHPVRQNLSKNGLTDVVGLMRTIAPVRYYLIDFDSAVVFEKGTPAKLRYIQGKAGRDDEVPEFISNNPYDPFKVDIFQFGNLLKKEFLQKYNGVEFLIPLVEAMTKIKPAERPHAPMLRVRFNTLRNRLTSNELRRHLSPKDTRDPLREHLATLGIESVLESETDDSPDHSSSEAPTTGHASNRSNDDYWSTTQSMESSVTSQSSVEQASHGPLHMLTSIFSKSRPEPDEPEPELFAQQSQGPSLWKPNFKRRDSSPRPVKSAPQPIPNSQARNGMFFQPPERVDSPEFEPEADGEAEPQVRTGKFPWSTSSSPDSVGGSPILAITDYFLRPQSPPQSQAPPLPVHSKGIFGDEHDDILQRNRVFAETSRPTREQPVAATQPGRNRRATVSATQVVPPTTYPNPPRDGSGWGAIDSTYDEPEPFPNVPSYEAQTLRQTSFAKKNKSTNALSAFSTAPYTAWDSPDNYYNQYSNQYSGHEHEHSNQYSGYEYEQHASDIPMDEQAPWAPEEILKQVKASSPPPPIPTTRPTDKKAKYTKEAKGAKEPLNAMALFSKIPSKKAELSGPAISSTTASSLRVASATAKSTLSSIVNRKSTIAVEDATPSNSPPRAPVELHEPAPPKAPSPTPAPSTSPTTNKTKKTKGRKASVTETPAASKEKESEKEKEKEKEEKSKSSSKNVIDEWEMPPMQEETRSRFGRRGSGSTATSRPTSPLAIFNSSRSNSKKDSSGKNSSSSTVKPSSSFKSTFNWGASTKAAPSPPLETQTAKSNGFDFDFGSHIAAFEHTDMDQHAYDFMSSVLQAGTDDLKTANRSEWTVALPGAASTIDTKPIGDQNSAYDSTSSSVAKSGWKSKKSSAWAAPTSGTSPKEVDDDLARLVAKMSIPPNTEVARAASKFDANTKRSSTFKFGLDSADMDDFAPSKASTPIPIGRKTSKVEPAASPEPEASPVFSKVKAPKSKATAASPEASDLKSTVTKAKSKKGAAKIAPRPSFSMESPEPTPTVEAEDPWTFTPVASTVKKTQPVTVEPKADTKAWGYSNWDFTNDDAEREEEMSVTEPEPVSVSPEVPSWSSKVSKSKVKKTNKVETTIAETADEVVETPVPAPAPASAWGKPKKASKTTNAWTAFSTSPEEKEETFTPVPEPAPLSSTKVDEVKAKQEYTADTTEENADDWWAPATKSKKGKKGGNTQEPAKPAPKNSWSIIEPEIEQKEDDDLAATLAATLEQEDDNKADEQPEADANTADKVTEKDSAPKAAAKATNNSKAGNKKKKGKR